MRRRGMAFDRLPVGPRFQHREVITAVCLLRKFPVADIAGISRGVSMLIAFNAAKQSSLPGGMTST